MNKKFKQSKQEYIKKLKDPRWQKKRLEVFNRDEWSCEICGDEEETLHVHHKIYQFGKEPWEYDLNLLVTLCEECHATESEDIKINSKVLIESAKTKFLSEDLKEIACGFNYMKLQHLPSVVASAIKVCLEDDEIQRFMINLYFKKIGMKSKQFWDEKVEKQKIELIVDNC